MTYTVGIVDDHKLMLQALSSLVSRFDNFTVVLEAGDGTDLRNMLIENSTTPDILLVDDHMPVMDGLATTKWLNENFPKIKVIANSMSDSERSVISMIKAGCRAYVLKDDIAPDELERVFNEVAVKGYYFENFNNRYRQKIFEEIRKIVPSQL